MLRIGYVRPSDPDHSHAAEALRDLGCHVVRVEENADGVELQPVLASILDFIGDGDELVALKLEHLGRSSRALLEVVDRLDQRGATLATTEPAVTSAGHDGETLRAVLRAMAALDPAEQPRRRPRAPAHEILALQRAGLGPVEIARRLGVSRMTVWRKLRSVEGYHDDTALDRAS
jgi:DNA invertase Pin-like site-specific DNA recombinase